MFSEMKIVPSLIFLDPWGYKGLCLDLINSVVKDWACECIFFFNYSRINMGLSNPTVKIHMEALFGAERADVLSKELEAMTPEERELTIVERAFRHEQVGEGQGLMVRQAREIEVAAGLA